MGELANFFRPLCLGALLVPQTAGIANARRRIFMVDRWAARRGGEGAGLGGAGPSFPPSSAQPPAHVHLQLPAAQAQSTPHSLASGRQSSLRHAPVAHAPACSKGLITSTREDVVAGKLAEHKKGYVREDAPDMKARRPSPHTAP